MNTEITKQSVELRRNLFKDTKITSSKELKNLYLKLNHISIQKLRMKYYHVKENKTVEILISAFLSITCSIPLPRATVTNIEGILPIKVAIK